MIEQKLMRILIFLLSVAMILITITKMAMAEPAAVLIKAHDSSLVIKEGKKEPSIFAKKDSLHTMLSRECQGCIFSGNTQISPQPYAWGKIRYFSPVQSWQKSAGPYLEILIHKYANRYGVDASLVRAVMRYESGFNLHAVSPKGAQGLMQLMPGTASLMGVNNPFDAEQNIAGGVGYLRHCLDCFGHNVSMAVAAYNAGPGRVAKSRGVPAIPETQAFVKNVMGAYAGRPTLSYPEAKTNNIPKPTISNPLSFKDRILYSSSRKGAPEDELEKVAARPQAKVIEVRFPSTK
jgi:hypothetical protein